MTTNGAFVGSVFASIAYSFVIMLAGYYLVGDDEFERAPPDHVLRWVCFWTVGLLISLVGAKLGARIERHTQDRAPKSPPKGK
jgi:hypothetical protein